MSPIGFDLPGLEDSRMVTCKRHRSETTKKVEVRHPTPVQPNGCSRGHPPEANCPEADCLSPFGPWSKDPAGNTAKIAETFRQAGKVASDHGERLAAEGEVCWGGMHSWKDMVDTLEATGMPETVGFQADLAHTYLYLLGVNAPEHALLKEGYSDDEFWAAYEKMTDALRPWTFDIHIAQNDGTVHGTGSHDKTGRHCRADDPNGKLDITKCAGYWLKDHEARGIKHLCWDGCMFDNAILEDGNTWNTILDAMVKVRDAHGWD